MLYVFEFHPKYLLNIKIHLLQHFVEKMFWNSWGLSIYKGLNMKETDLIFDDIIEVPLPGLKMEFFFYTLN